MVECNVQGLLNGIDGAQRMLAESVTKMEREMQLAMVSESASCTHVC
jgi:hypothetical protein